MSHYSVTVVLDGERAAELLERGETLNELLEEVLAPFNEELAGPRRPDETWSWAEGEAPYGPLGVDKREGLDYVNDEVKAANSWEALYLYIRDEYGSDVEFDPEARTLTSFTHYNEHSKWDWWTIGGRWEKYFRAKSAYGGVNYVLVNDLDIDSMVDDDLATRMGRYDDVRRIVGDLAAEHITWRSLLEQVDAGQMDINQARAMYGQQPTKRAISAEAQKNHDYVWIDLDDFMVPREQYEKQVRNGAVPTYALLGKDGVWTEPGRMGWFGMSTETPATLDEYQAAYMAYLETLDPIDVLVCVDAHI